MLNALKTLLAEFSTDDSAGPATSQTGKLQLAVAGLLHEMMRVDSKQTRDEARVASGALIKMFGLTDPEARALLEQAGTQRLTSYFDPASIIKRMLSIEQRFVLVENLWKVAFADDDLNVYEDQFVRKIAGLIYVSNTDCMLARQSAKNSLTT